MNIEQLALLGIIIFGFMAVVNIFNTVRTYRRYHRMKPMRVRRLVGGKESAKAIAESLIKDVMADNPEATRIARQSGNLPPELSEKLNEVRAYYLNRVEPIHKTLFNETVDTLLHDRDRSVSPKE
jgi:hypothetical protein